MAVRIPTSADLPFVTPRAVGGLPQYPAEDPGAAGMVALGKGAAAAAGALGDIEDARQRKQNQVNAALAEADLSANLFRDTEELKNERDPAKVDEIKARLSGHLARAEQTITDPETRQLWSAKYRIKIVEAEALADRQQRSIYYDRFRAGASQQLEGQIKIAAQASDPEEREAAKRRIGQIIGSLEQSGAMTSEKAQAATLEAGEKIIIGHADWLSANGRHGEAQDFLRQNERAVDPGRLRTYNDYLRPRVDKEAGLRLLDQTAPGARPISGDAVERFLNLAETHESGGKNIEQQVVGPNGGYNPSTGTVTGPSSASGNFQITDTTWKAFAPKAGVDISQYPRAIRAPYEVQRQVARTIATTDGVQHWTDFNKTLRAAVQREGLPVSGPVVAQAKDVTAPTEEELAAAPTSGEPISLDEPAQPKVPDWQAWGQRINAASGTKEQKDIAKSELRQLHNEFSLGQAEAASDLTLAVGRGEKGREDIEAAYQTGRISPEKRTQLHTYFDKLAEQRAALAEAMTRVGAAGNGGAPLDPKSKTDRDALSVHYDAVSKTWPPDQALDRAVGYAVQYGLIPEKLKSAVRGGLHSGHVDQAVLAAETVSRLRNANPQLIGEIGDENDLRLATLISTYTTAGVPAETAVRTAIESMKVGKPEREARAADFDVQRGKSTTDREKADKTWIEGKLNSVWTVDPTVDPVMRREFEEVAKAEFERTGNLDASRQMALDTVNRVWGRSRVGGNGIRYMKLAPEKFYGVATLTPEQNSAWMNEQLAADVAKGAFADPRNPITADRLMLVPSPTTAPDGRPTYVVLLKDASGVFNTVTKDGMPQVWVPDWTSSAEHQRQQEGKRRNIEQLRQQRVNPAPAFDFLFRGGATLQEQLSRGSGETP